MLRGVRVSRARVAGPGRDAAEEPDPLDEQEPLNICENRSEEAELPYKLAWVWRS